MTDWNQLNNHQRNNSQPLIMFKEITLCCALILVLSLSGASSEEQPFRSHFAKTDQLSHKELRYAFDELNKFLEAARGSTDPSGLKAAKKLRSLVPGAKESHLQRAARYYVYLNEFESCEPKSVEYMFDVLRGCEFAEPGREATSGSGRVRSKRWMEKQLESLLVRASGKCRSYVETWFRDSEKKVDLKSRQALYELMSHDAIEMADDLGDFCANSVLKDQRLARQLSTMDQNQLRKFFTTYISEHFVEPCKKYVGPLSGVMGAAYGLGVMPGSKLFDEPSQDFLDATHRYIRCKSHLGWNISSLGREANVAAQRYLEGKKEAL